MAQPTPPFDELIERACCKFQADARAAPERWRELALSSAGAARLIASPATFLAWASAHRRWSQVVAACAAEVCAKPAEAAVHVLIAIVEELFHERGVL